nr:beta-defensin {peptide BNBD-4} [cattle, Peptide, 42 aa] [Bos taurus]
PERVRNPQSCRWNMGVCIPFLCRVGMRQIGTCFGPRVPCCRR